MKFFSSRLSRIIWLTILAGVIFSKFVWLDRFPAGMAHDEAIYLANGVSYMTNGSDLSGYSFPLSLFRTKTEGAISFVPTYIYGIYSLLTPLTPFSTRLLLTLVNLMTAYILFLFTKKIFNNTKLATTSALLFLINPWSYFLARWAVDTPWALLFSLASFHFLIRAKTKSYFVLSSVFFILAFFSYQGAKIILLPFMLIIAVYKFKQDGQVAKKITVWSTLLVTMFVISYFAIDSMLPGDRLTGRKNDIVIFRQDDIAHTVDAIRRNSIEFPYSHILINKPSVMLETVAKKYFSVFSPEVLFFSGDTRATYRYEDHGLFFVIDSVFIFVGAFALFRKRRKIFYLLTSLLLVSPLTTALGAVDTSQVNRSFLALPIMTMFVAYGINYAFGVKNRSFQKAAAVLIFLLYLISYVKFLHFYYFQLPISQQENYFLTDKIISRYIDFTDPDRSIYVVTNTPRSSFCGYALYTNKLENLASPDTARDSFSLDSRVIFSANCPTFNDSSTYIIIAGSDCHKDKKQDNAILDHKDAGTLYNIYNDATCNKNDAMYRRFHLLDDYDLDSLDKTRFCESWIHAPKI
ncbi:hypothetical protein IPM62_00750 [Candidatus Woesebacteria bacterium]|nr:MAG: hypothetical protein IPM62_00750 [Candidatus Woesebacteria bacterium]